MAKKFLTPVGLPSGTGLPIGTAAGQMFYKTDTGQINIYNGSVWVAVGAQGDPGVAFATSPLAYNSTTKTVSLNESALVIDGGTA